MKRVASSVRRSVPHPRSSKLPFAYIIEDLTKEFLKPDLNTAKSWVAWLTSKKLSRGNVIIIDALTSATWQDCGAAQVMSDPLDKPHAMKPLQVSFHHNKELLVAVEAVVYLIKRSITAPVISHVAGPFILISAWTLLCRCRSHGMDE